MTAQDILAQEIDTCLVHAEYTDRGKMILPVMSAVVFNFSEIEFGVWIKIVPCKFFKNLAFNG